MAVIQEAWIGGVSTRRVDDLVQAMGLSGIRKSTVSKLCKDIDERINAFLDRPLAGEWPYLWLDATYLKQLEGGEIRLVAVIIAVALTTEGKREIVGLHIGPSKAETFWSAFLKSLVRRGLRGTKLAISDAHEGLKAAIRRVLGCTWQRCRVHWMRNAQAYVSKGQQNMVSVALCQAFIPPDYPNARQTLRHVADQLRDKWPKLGAFIDESEADVLAHMNFPGVQRQSGWFSYCLIQECSRAAARLPRQNAPVARVRRPGATSFAAVVLRHVSPLLRNAVQWSRHMLNSGRRSPEHQLMRFVPTPDLEAALQGPQQSD